MYLSYLLSINLSSFLSSFFFAHVYWNLIICAAFSVIRQVLFSFLKYLLLEHKAWKRACDYSHDYDHKYPSSSSVILKIFIFLSDKLLARICIVVICEPIEVYFSFSSSSFPKYLWNTIIIVVKELLVGYPLQSLTFVVILPQLRLHDHVKNLNIKNEYAIYIWQNKSLSALTFHIHINM